MSEPIIEPIWIRYADWPGGRQHAVEALLPVADGNPVPLLWTTDQETGRVSEWWPYQLGMFRGRR
jgi:hypothetical protein